MNNYRCCQCLLAVAFLSLSSISGSLIAADTLGLPTLQVPVDNPQTPAKIALGDKLFNDNRFSSTGEVSCATCHEPSKVFTDSPLQVSQGINQLTGTRNAPTVVNAAFNESQFWDGRSADLEDQSIHPFVNPVEMGLPDHEPILAVIRSDKAYQQQFESVFGVLASAVTMAHVSKAIAAFERSQVSGGSPFDQWYFGHQQDAISPAAQRGFTVFLGQGRCVSCHVIEQDHALFTDHNFHNIGIGVNELGDKITPLAQAFLSAKDQGIDVDIAVLTDADSSHLGHFAVNDELSALGAFKTPTLRNIARTAPYMHDGSLATLREVVEHYNNGGAKTPGQPINPFISGGIRPLELSEQQIDDLVAFMETLTSPEYAVTNQATNQE